MLGGAFGQRIEMARVIGYAAVLLAPLLVGAGPADDGLFHAGGYSFSDELGGFRIRDISGAGTRSDPIVIEQELFSASPVTLVIRSANAIKPFAGPDPLGSARLYLRLVTLNNSGLAWTEFEFELQEILGRPSVHGDGLSFDQRRASPENRTADVFRIHNTDFEPFDRLLFSDGKIDPLETGTFGFLITDFTPTAEFYLRQDPRIPIS